MIDYRNPEKRISELRQDRCPLCGGPNDCGLVAGKNECWCEKVAMSRDVLERMPDDAKRVCVCAKCGMAPAAVGVRSNDH